MLRMTSRPGAGMLCAAVLLAAAAPETALAQTTFPPNSLKSCTLGSEFDADWTTITLNLNLPTGPATLPVGPAYDTRTGLVYVFPPDGPSFQASGGDSQCKFFKWGAQMFYWATSTIEDDLNTPPTSVVPPDDLTPYVFDTEFFYRVSDAEAGQQRQFIGQGNGGPDGALAIRTLKSAEVGQAGGGDVLISRANSLVYYGIHTNRLYGYFLTQQANQPGTTQGQFPTTKAEVCSTLKYSRDNGLSAVSAISTLLYSGLCDATPPAAPGAAQADVSTQSLLASLGPTDEIPQIETAVDYLAMTVEMKTSWVDAATVGDQSEYIVQTHDVPIYNKLTADIWEPAGTESKELALVGMHIVASVEGHPEMIWATVEHRNNAPNVSYPYLNATGNLVYGSDDDGAGDWLFWDPNGGSTTITSLKPSATLTSNGNIVSEDGVNIVPVNVKRFHPWGGPVYDTNTEVITPEMLATAKTNSDLISVNQDIVSRITGFYAGKNMAVTDPRLNYFVSGATWTSDGSIPTFGNAGSASKITGSTVLANTTMETFHQADNCFACHSADSSSTTPPPGLTTSHIFGSIQKLPIKGQ